MADGAIGIGSGFMQGQLDQASLTASKDTHDLTQVQIETSRMNLEKMKRLNDALSKLNNMHSQPGSVPAGPAAQAWEASSMFYDVAQAALAAGSPEQAKEFAKDASQIGSNAALMEERLTGIEAKNAELASNLMGWVKEAKNPQEASKRWQTSIMLWQQQTGKKSPYAGVQYSPEVVDAVQAKTISAKEESELKYKEIEGRKAEEQIKLDKLTEGLRVQQTAAAKARAEYLQKHGGMTPSQVKAAGDQADAREASLKRIDELEALIDKEPGVVGFRGTLSQYGEFAKTVTGLGDQATPATDFKSKLDALKMALPTALGAKNTRLKVVQQHLEDLSNLRGRATSAAMAKTMLDDLRTVLTEGTEKKAGGKEGEREKVWDSQDAVVKAYHDNEITYEQAKAYLHDQFGLD